MLTKLTIRSKLAIALISTGLLGSVVFFQNCSHDSSRPDPSVNLDTVDVTGNSKISTSAAGASCAFNGEEVLHGDSVLAYLNSSGRICESQIRTCNNGTMSGSFAYASCVVEAPRACLFNGVTVAHGQQVQAFLNSSGVTCSDEMRMCNNGVLSGSYAYSTCAIDIPDSCLFNGQTVPHTSNVNAYQNSSVPFGQTCTSQLRNCNDGNLSGSFAYASCTVDAPNTCLFNGQTVAHGQEVVAFQNSTVAFGQTCVSQVRTCDDGALAGTYQHSTCNVDAPNACLFNGQTVAHGQNVMAFLNSTVPYGQSCTSQTRTCDNGGLSGSYSYGSCTVNTPANCLFNGQTVAHGQKVVAYQTTAVPFGSSCQAEERTCTDGSLTGTFTNAACVVDQPMSCNFNGNLIAHGQTVTAYELSSVPYGEVCGPETRTCNNGELDGSNEFASCTVEAPKSCQFDGRTIAHGESLVAYLTSTVPYRSKCQPEVRACTNGTLSGSATFANCAVDGPAACLFNGKTIAHGDKVRGYFTKTVPKGKKCKSELRSCKNGALTGSAAYPTCKVATPPSYWINAKDGEKIQNTCARAKMRVSANMGEGICASGENRPDGGGSNWNKISYRFGKKGRNLIGGTSSSSHKVGKKVFQYCWVKKQKIDYNKTDIAVAYLCQKK